MKKVKRIIYIFLFSLLVVGLSKNVQANSISKIAMDIYINSAGDASITEVWTCNASQGTEVYHPYYNLGNSEIKDLKVKENGIYYQTLSSWNTSGTLSSKANKCGINKISNGVELCWGISEYGTHTYTVEYTITKFVSELTDAQMIYWTLIPYEFSNSIGNVYIKIYTDFKIADTVDVWGYGNYGGTAYVYNGYIEMQSDGRLDTDEYMTILVKFPKGTFNTTNELDYNFNYYYTLAEDGAVHYKDNSSVSGILQFLVKLLCWVPFVIVAIAVAKPAMRSGLNFGTEGKRISKDVPYYRDIPCNKDIMKAYYIAHTYGLLKEKTDILGAIILKWIRESVVRVGKKEAGMIFKKEDTTIIFNVTNSWMIQDDQEREIFEMLYEASKDGILENKEFEKWCRNHYNKILNWFDTVLKVEKTKLINEGLIVQEEKTTFKIFKHKVYTVTPELRQQALELAGLKRYLKDYTLIKDREAIEVALFEEYLIFAQLMGIAKEVAKEFKDLYPEMIEKSNFNSYDDIIFINYYARTVVTGAKAAKSRAESYSSGGGGFSSGGGGGGSFGGGGGGRRVPLMRVYFK